MLLQKKILKGRGKHPTTALCVLFLSLQELRAAALCFEADTGGWRKTSLIMVLPRLDAWDKRSDPVHWEDLEGAGGEGGGRGDRDGEHM